MVFVIVCLVVSLPLSLLDLQFSTLVAEHAGRCSLRDSPFALGSISVYVELSGWWRRGQVGLELPDSWLSARFEELYGAQTLSVPSASGTYRSLE